MAQKYKVYLNRRVINVIPPKDAATKGKGIIKRHRPFNIKREWTRFQSDNSCKELYLIGDTEKTWKEFKKLFKTIIAAGGLVKNRDNKYLLILRNKKWDLPKGKRDKGEAVKDTAVREVEEECGVNKLKITGTLPCTYHIYELRGEMALKKTYWYKMSTTSDKKLVPQKEEGIEKAQWLRPTEIKRKKKEIYPSVWQLVQDID